MNEKIIYVVDNLNIGGAQTQLTRLVAGLAVEGQEVLVICLGGYNDALVQQIGRDRIYFLEMTCIWTLPFWKSYHQMKKIISQKQPDIVHTYLNTSNVFGACAAKKNKVPFIVTSRRDMGHFRSNRIAKMEKWANRFCQRIVCVSEAVKVKTMQDEHLSEDQVVVLYGGIDTNRFHPIQREHSDDQFIVGMVATMDRELKGHKDFLQTAKSVLAQRKDVRFILIGDGELRSSLEAFVRDAGMQEYIEFKGQHKDIRQEVQKMDLLVLPSHSEGFSNAVLEAMALQVPVLANALEGNLEIIKDEETGFLVKPRDTEAMAQIILRWMDQREQLGQIGKNARKCILDKFTISHMVNRYKSFYNHLRKTQS